MRFLKQNTAVRITVGPFFDKTDGVTPETGIAVTGCKLTMTADYDNGSGVALVLDAAPTTGGGNNDMVHITNDDAGFYDLELTAANTNYLGRSMISITDAATHCPVFHEFMILPSAVYDSLVGGTDNLPVDVTQVGGSSTPIDGKSLEAALRYIAAVCSGKISGAGTGVEVFKGLDGSTTRITISVDETGNRTGIVYD